MLNILLSDDDKFILELEKQRIREEIEKHNFDAQIACISTDSGEIFRYIENNEGEYLVFLDLDFGVGKLNGIDVARRIKQLSSKSKIVFVTNHQELAMNVLKSGVEPFGFIEKTVDMEKLALSCKKYIQMALNVFEIKEDNSEKIELSLGFDEKVLLKKNDIMYVETVKSMSHCIAYHTIDGSEITVRGTIEQCLGELGDKFKKCHRSIVVNVNHILAMENGMLKLTDGTLISCAIRLKNEMKKYIK